MSYGQTVTIRRYSTDRYGDRTVASTHTIDECVFAPAYTRTDTEIVDRSQQVISDARLFCPAGADIAPVDEVQLANGTLWEVSGRAQDWDSPWEHWHPGVVVELLRRTG